MIMARSQRRSQSCTLGGTVRRCRERQSERTHDGCASPADTSRRTISAAPTGTRRVVRLLKRRPIGWKPPQRAGTGTGDDRACPLKRSARADAQTGTS